MKKDLVTRSCHETVSSCACGASLSCHSSWVRAFRSSQNAGLGKKQCLIHRGVKQIHMQMPFLLLVQVALLCRRWFDFICGKLEFTRLPLDYVQRFMLTFRARKDSHIRFERGMSGNEVWQYHFPTVACGRNWVLCKVKSFVHRLDVI